MVNSYNEIKLKGHIMTTMVIYGVRTKHLQQIIGARIISMDEWRHEYCHSITIDISTMDDTESLLNSLDKVGFGYKFNF